MSPISVIRSFAFQNSVICAQPMRDLFDTLQPDHNTRETIAEGAVLLRGKALRFETEILPRCRRSPHNRRSAT